LLDLINIGLNLFRLQGRLLIGINIFQFRVCYLTSVRCYDYTAAVTNKWVCSIGGMVWTGRSRSTPRFTKFSTNL